MKEEYLHFAFRRKMFGDTFTTADNKQIKVIDFGEHNRHAGPDFLDVIIEYDGKKWSGAIEFHVNASDWYKHGHQHDPAYGSVLAHFVLNHDAGVSVNNFLLPVVELKELIDFNHYDRYKEFSKPEHQWPCKKSLKEVPAEVVNIQKERSLKERLWKKALILIRDLEACKGDRKKVFWLAVARVFGGEANKLPFENLMAKLNTGWLAKLNYDPVRTEALLFGVSGILPDECSEPYVKRLSDEFAYQKQLFNIKPGENPGWKYSRMRPYSFPDLRLAQFAALLRKEFSIHHFLFSGLTVSEMKTELRSVPTVFWNNHFRLNTRSKRIIRSEISESMIDLILINAAVPFLYAVGLLEGNDDYTRKALRILSEIKPENNRIITAWKAAGITVRSANDSQSLLELKKHGCNRKKCLFCAIGKQILNR